MFPEADFASGMFFTKILEVKFPGPETKFDKCALFRILGTRNGSAIGWGSCLQNFESKITI